MANRYWVGKGGTWDATTTTNWSATSGGSSGASAPTSADSVFINQAQALTITISGTASCLDLTDTNTLAHSFAGTGVLNISGSMTLSTTTTWSGTGAITFKATTTGKTITPNGVTISGAITFDGVGGAWSLGGALTMASGKSITLTNGTLDLNGKTCTTGTNFTTATGTKDLTFNAGTLVCPAASATAFNNAVPTGFTITAGTGVGVISMTAATAKTFVGGGSTFNCTLQNAGAGALTITDSNTFTNISNSVQPTTFTFTAGTTTTVTNWNINGTAGNLVTIGSATAASHTLSKASGTVNSNYLSISRSTATGGATWNAGANSTDGGNNSGWIFSAPPPATATGNFLVFF